MRRKLPSMHAIVAFEASASHLNFTRAAEELNVQQPAISRQIQALEDDLGVTLFVRHKRALELTEAGHRLYRAAITGLDAIEIAAETLRTEKGPSQLAIGAHFGIAAYWLNARLAKFRKLCPHIDIRLMTRRQDERVDFADADIFIRFGEGSWPGVDATYLFGEQVFPVCSPAYLKGRKPPLKVENLEKECLLHLNDSHYRWIDWSVLFRANGYRPALPLKGITVDNFSLLMQSALNGEGIALGWGRLVDDYLQAGQLVRPTNITLESDRGWYCLIKDRNKASREIMQFVDWVKHEVDDVAQR